MPEARAIRVARALAELLALLVVVQFYTAGLAIFGASSFRSHAALGLLALVVALALLTVSLVRPRTARQRSLATACFTLTLLQPVLVFVARPRLPAVAALHPIVGLLIGLLAWRIAVAGRGSASEASPSPRAAVVP
jgi:hypothetical protein